MASSTFKVRDKVRIKRISRSWEREYRFHKGDTGKVIAANGGACVVRFTHLQDPTAGTPGFGPGRLWIAADDLEKVSGLLDI